MPSYSTRNADIGRYLPIRIELLSVRVRFTNLPGRFEILETSLILETFPQSEGLTKKVENSIIYG